MSDEKFKKLIIDMGYNYNEITTLFDNPIYGKEFEEKSQMNLAIIMLLEYMNSFGFSNEEAIKIVKKYPKLLILNIGVLDNKLSYYMERFGYTKENLKDMINHFPLFLILTQEYVCQRVDDVMKLEYTQEQVKDITIQSPTLYVLNIEYLREKDNFYRSIGLEGIFMKTSKSISWSVELVYARYMFYKSMGINIDNDNYDILFEIEHDFFKKHGKSDRQLMEEYPYPKYSFKRRK